MESSNAMISLRNIVKTFPGNGSAVHAVQDVTLDVRRGEIFGIVGFSGAGKSTLVRCINLLEKPTEGQVVVDGVEMSRLKGKALNRERRKIGMIFQQFNLFATRTVFDNVAFPLRHTGLTKGQIREKVLSLLRYVELEEKADAYPSQLSGGQKQRVAIARALATDPKVLLCDEATSALDPITTTSILKLLKKLNRETGITMVVITHQMQVVKELCQRVAVMENGRVVEEGDVFDIFAWPKQPVTRSFVASAGEVAPEEAQLQAGADEYVIRLKFFGHSANDAVISQVSRRFGVDMNILSGSIEMIDGRPLGQMAVRMSGTEKKLQDVLGYLKEIRVEAEVTQHAGAAQ